MKVHYLFTVHWWVDMFFNVFITMLFIYMIKKTADKYKIPFVQKIADEV